MDKMLSGMLQANALESVSTSLERAFAAAFSAPRSQDGKESRVNPTNGLYAIARALERIAKVMEEKTPSPTTLPTLPTKRAEKKTARASRKAK
jgi:hypothetical protein